MLTNFSSRWIQTRNSLSDFRQEINTVIISKQSSSKTAYIIPQRAKMKTLMNLNNFVSIKIIPLTWWKNLNLLYHTTIKCPKNNAPELSLIFRHNNKSACEISEAQEGLKIRRGGRKMMGIICPLNWDRVNWSAKIWRGDRPLSCPSPPQVPRALPHCGTQTKDENEHVAIKLINMVAPLMTYNIAHCTVFHNM